MKKITHSCDYCEQDLLGWNMGYFEVRYVSEGFNLPPLDFCKMECMMNYLNKKNELINEGLIND